MNKEIKAQWLTALRGGEYAQGWGQLRKGNEFCCLGVLCDLAEKAGVIESHEDEWNIHHYGDNGESSVLPYAVRQWVSLLHFDPEVRTGSGVLALSKVNDELNYSFYEIAELIEEQL